ncbi:hypothetical protein, partial [Halochromatium sp.]
HPFESQPDEVPSQDDEPNSVKSGDLGQGDSRGDRRRDDPQQDSPRVVGDDPSSSWHPLD